MSTAYDRFTARFEYKFDDCDKFAKESLKLFSVAGEPCGEGASRHLLGHVQEQQGNFLEAMFNFQKVQGICKKLGFIEYEALALEGVSRNLRKFGQSSKARQVESQIATLLGQSDQPDLMLAILYMLFASADMHGDYAVVKSTGEDFLKRFQGRAASNVVTEIMMSLAAVCAVQKDYAASADWCRKCLAINEKASDRGGMAWCMESLGKALSLSGDPKGAQAQIQQSLRLNRERNNSEGVANCLALLARISTALKDMPGARSFLGQAVPMAPKVHDRTKLNILVAIAELWIEEGDASRGTALLAQVQADDESTKEIRDNALRILAKIGAKPALPPKNREKKSLVQLVADFSR